MMAKPAKGTAAIRMMVNSCANPCIENNDDGKRSRVLRRVLLLVPVPFLPLLLGVCVLVS